MCHLFLVFRAGEIPPLLQGLAEVDLIESDLDLADLVVLRETVKIIHRKHQRLRGDFRKRNLEYNNRYFSWAYKTDKIIHCKPNVLDASTANRTLNSNMVIFLGHRKCYRHVGII